MDSKLYNSYFARNQQVLTQGAAKTDVAVYYLYPPSQSIKTRHWRDLKLQEAGYTRDYLNPAMLDLPIVTVRGGRLAPDGPAYKALINTRLESGRVKIRVRLSRDNAVLIALSEDARYLDAPSPAFFVTATGAGDAAFALNGLVMHTSKSGALVTALSNGRSLKSEVKHVPASINLTEVRWHLSIEDWQPANLYATTVGPDAAQTQKANIEVDLDH